MKTIITLVAMGMFLTILYFGLETPPKTRPLSEVDEVKLDSLILESSKRDLNNRREIIVQDQILDECQEAAIIRFNQNKNYSEYEKSKKSCYTADTDRVIEQAKALQRK